jgi:hypothetical protein
VDERLVQLSDAPDSCGSIILHQKNIASVKEWCQYHPQESVMAGLQSAISPQ